jgi:hypothetical protein
MAECMVGNAYFISCWNELDPFTRASMWAGMTEQERRDTASTFAGETWQRVDQMDEHTLRHTAGVAADSPMQQRIKARIAGADLVDAMAASYHKPRNPRGFRRNLTRLFMDARPPAPAAPEPERKEPEIVPDSQPATPYGSMEDIEYPASVPTAEELSAAVEALEDELSIDDFMREAVNRAGAFAFEIPRY